MTGQVGGGLSEHMMNSDNVQAESCGNSMNQVLESVKAHRVCADETEVEEHRLNYPDQDGSDGDSCILTVGNSSLADNEAQRLCAVEFGDDEVETDTTENNP